MLTNFKTIRESVKKLEKIEKMEADGTFENLPKKEVVVLSRQKEKLESVLGGIRNIRKSPDLIFIVDTLREHLAVAEARRLNIPVAAIADTNSNPDELEFPIPANDDAIKSVKVITEAISNAIIDSTKDLKVKEMKEGKEERNADKTSKDDKKAAPRKRRVVKKKESTEA
jgi:small subunit ribosomal protein S2